MQLATVNVLPLGRCWLSDAELAKGGTMALVTGEKQNKEWDLRWYPGAGINRHVWLVKTDPVHFKHWGTHITNPKVSKRIK